MSTVLAHLDSLNRAVSELEFGMQDDGQSAAFKPVMCDIKNIWALWGREITARYFAAKSPNAAKQIPYAAIPTGALIDRLTFKIEGASSKLEALQHGLKAEPLDAINKIYTAFSAFSAYRTHSEQEINKLLELNEAAEDYLLDLQIALDEEAPPIQILQGNDANS